MANYISALNGEQMDAALTDVALHNSEAWAVGTRNTIPVSSSDETYHNNAKYYAQVAQSAIPGTYTAAVRWDIAQGLAGEAQEQARANISAGSSNRNLLDNPFFQVNQRNYTNNSANGDYVADRWFLYGAPTLTVTNSGNGIVLTGSGDARLRHHIDEKLFMTSYGQPLTFSIKVNGQVYSHTFNNVSSYPSAQTGLFDTTISTSAGNVNIAAAWQNANHVVLVYFRAYAPMTIQAVKLELGSYSTLANDVPPDYGEELDKCLYYFERVAPSPQSHVTLGWGYSEGNATTYFSTKMHPKHKQPTITAYSLAVSGTNSMNISTTGLSIYSWSATGHATIRFLAAAGSFTSGNLYRCGILNGGFIDFSSDL